MSRQIQIFKRSRFLDAHFITSWSIPLLGESPGRLPKCKNQGQEGEIGMVWCLDTKKVMGGTDVFFLGWKWIWALLICFLYGFACMEMMTNNDKHMYINRMKRKVAYIIICTHSYGTYMISMCLYLYIYIYVCVCMYVFMRLCLLGCPLNLGEAMWLQVFYGNAAPKG